MPSFVSVEELARSGLPNPADYVVFGGTFDPFHRGHLDVVRSLLEVFSRVVIAPTRQNPWKTSQPAPLDQRREMIGLILEAEALKQASAPGEPGVWIEKSGYEFAEELVKELRQRLNGRLHWAVGEDSAAGVAQWRNFSALSVPVVTLPVRIPEHSTGVREKTMEIHPAIKVYAEEHGLYR